MSTAVTKQCPFCAETIKAAAILCRFCGRDLPPLAAPDGSAAALTPDSPQECSASTPSIRHSEIFDLLTALVEKSLVVYEADASGHGRYRLLETVRQYSRDRLLEHGEGAVLRDRHRDWFVEQAEHYEPGIWTEQEPYFAFAGAEHANLHQALVWSRDDAAGGEAHLRLAASLGLYWLHTGALTEARRWLEAALARTPDAPTSVRARALMGLGMVAAADDPVARRSLEESVALCRATGDEIQLLAALNALGYLCARCGERARGEALLDEARVLSRGLGGQFGLYCDFYTGLYAHLVGDDAEAEQLLERVTAHPQTWESVRHFALAVLGEARVELGKMALARTSFAEALARARPLYGTLTILMGFSGLARVWLAEGDAARSARLLGAAAAQAERLAMAQLPTDTGAVERTAAGAREALGERDFQAAFAQGRALTLEQALKRALEQALALEDDS